MTAPTPRPWTVTVSPDLFGHYMVKEAAHRQEHVLEGQDLSDEDEANARLIERAVNVHDDLVAVLRELVQVPNKKRPERVWDHARAALRKASAGRAKRAPRSGRAPKVP